MELKRPVLWYVVIFLGLLCMGMALGCQQSGLAGVVYCGEDQPLTFDLCPCDQTLICTRAGCTCVPSDLEADGEFPE